MIIHKSQHPKLKSVRRYMTQSSFPKSAPFYILETRKAISDALSYAPDSLDYLLIDDAITCPPDWPDEQCYRVESVLFSELSSVVTSQGVVGVFKKPSWVFDASAYHTVMILDGVQDPSNLGAMFRNAAAFGVDAIFLSKGCVSPFLPNALRAMTGLLSQVPFFVDGLEYVSSLVDSGFQVYGLSVQGGESLASISFSEKVAFIFGSEGKGLQTDMGVPIEALTISMAEGVESLNVGVSSGIALYKRYSDR